MNATELWTGQPYTVSDEGKRYQIVQHRNKLLMECNWTQLPDANLITAQKIEWQTYREALQIIEFSNPNPDLIVFPAPPAYTNGPMPIEITDYRLSRGDLRAQVLAALARLEQIETATTFTNAQVIQAIKDMASYEKKIIKVIVRMI